MTAAVARLLEPRAGVHQELYDPSGKRQIRHAASIPAMDAAGHRSARWTRACASGRPNRNDGPIALATHTFYNKPTRHQTGAVECLLNGADAPPIKAQTSCKLHKK